jgi:hypothetical protein
MPALFQMTLGITVYVRQFAGIVLPYRFIVMPYFAHAFRCQMSERQFVRTVCIALHQSCQDVITEARMSGVMSAMVLTDKPSRPSSVIFIVLQARCLIALQYLCFAVVCQARPPGCMSVRSVFSPGRFVRITVCMSDVIVDTVRQAGQMSDVVCQIPSVVCRLSLPGCIRNPWLYCLQSCQKLYFRLYCCISRHCTSGCCRYAVCQMSDVVCRVIRRPVGPSGPSSTSTVRPPLVSLSLIQTLITLPYWPDSQTLQDVFVRSGPYAAGDVIHYASDVRRQTHCMSTGCHSCHS